MQELITGRSYPLPTPGRLVAMRAMAETDMAHPVVSTAFDWLRAVARVQLALPEGEGFLYHGDEVRAGDAVAPLALWEGLVVLPFVEVRQWEEGLSFGARVEMRSVFEQFGATRPFVDAAPLRCQPRLLLAPMLDAAQALEPVRELGEWHTRHRSARLRVMIPLLAPESRGCQVEGWS